MDVQNHLLLKGDSRFKVTQSDTPNMGAKLAPRFLIMHFTAGNDAASSINWLRNPQAQASAHLVIDRKDGATTQLVPFNKVAWHAGKSEWHGLVGMNAFSIGIELDNAGRLVREGGAWKTWTRKVVPDDQVVELTHKNETTQAGWHTYSEPQIAAALEAAVALHATYQFEDILGHEDIAPIRKSDPGPAFPMASFKARVLGRQ
jgi:N-acetylmuramoyl-L-alanine amidase